MRDAGLPTECSDEIVTRFSQNADVWQRVAQAQPSSRALSSGRLVRRLMDVYYMRLFITVAPTTVTARPSLPETTRQFSVPAVPGLPPTIAREIGGFPSGVLASLDSSPRGCSRRSAWPVACVAGPRCTWTSVDWTVRRSRGTSSRRSTRG